MPNEKSSTNTGLKNHQLVLALKNNVYFQKLKYLLLFLALFIAFQLTWKVADHFFSFVPLLQPLFELSIKFNVEASSWILSTFMNVQAGTRGHMIVLPGWTLEIYVGCEGLKQILFFILMMLVFPGKGSHKVWFIPAGVLFLLLINVLRFVGLCLTLLKDPALFRVMHDQVFYIIYYGGVFGLWAIWEAMFIEKKGQKA
jgi:exosortase/archaeosortase family protein